MCVNRSKEVVPSMQEKRKTGRVRRCDVEKEGGGNVINLRSEGKGEGEGSGKLRNPARTLKRRRKRIIGCFWGKRTNITFEYVPASTEGGKRKWLTCSRGFRPKKEKRGGKAEELSTEKEGGRRYILNEH